MVKLWKKFYREHTPAGRYIAEVEEGTRRQKIRAAQVIGEDWTDRLFRVVDRNHTSVRISELFQSRG